MRKIIFSLCAVLITTVASAQLKIKVVGTVTGDTEGHNKVFFYNRMDRDSAEIKDGKFEFNITEPGFGSRAISIDYDRVKRRMYSPVTLFYDQSGTIEVSFDIVKGLSSSTVRGMKSAVDFFNYGAEKVNVFQLVRNKTLEKYGTDAFKKDSPNFDEANKYREQLNVDLSDSLLNVFFQPTKQLAPVFLTSVTSVLPVERLEYYYNQLSNSVKSTDEAKSVYAKIQGLKNAYIGAVVKDFQLPNEKGTKRSFNEFKGKYVLLDFWASWCSPCRASFPRVREVYSKLAGKNFEIINISIDQNKQAWLKAVEEESNPWPQLYDDTKISSSLFNVSAIPTCYLIDPSGKIIMKEIGFDPKGGGEIEKKLEEIFKVKF